MSSKVQSKRLLYEVSIIRPVVIFLLVLMHSFTMYGGGWSMPEGINNVKAYFWLSKLISGFRIETIALIAGYVFSYQSKELGRKYKFIPFMKKKFMRLIVPGIFFSIIYFFLFNYNPSTFNPLVFSVKVLSGVGHMWFLPMLFWSFALLWVFDHYNLTSYKSLILLAILSITPIPFSIPFGIGTMFHFAFYVIVGFVLFIEQDRFMNFMSRNKAILIAIMYVFVVIVNQQFIRPIHIETTTIYSKGMMAIVSNSFKFLSSVTGISVLYYIVIKYISKEGGIEQKQWIIGLSGISYGVYIYHQFILIYLYYHTTLPLILGSYWLPWVGLLVSLFLSVILTKFTLRTNIGRFLIG